MEQNSSSRRLAKNTIILYLRTLLMTVVGFFTTRVILQALGVEDYGIQNVVGGFVGMFAVVQTTLSSATSRFMTFELGKGGGGEPGRVFSIVMATHVALAAVMALLLEGAGLYLLNHGLNIPPERLWAANWVFHLSVAGTVVGVLNSPYIGLIVAHERMDVFAYFSMADVFIKLAVIYLLYATPWDHLVSLSVFYLCIGLVITAVYNAYSRRAFPEARFRLVRRSPKYGEILRFAGLNFAGGLASMLSSNGTGVLINLFYGVTLNAAMGIASQVQAFSTKFVGDFITALKPQITKEYAAGERLRAMRLAFRGSRFSYFLTIILAVPIVARTPYLLHFWLGAYPEHAVLFARLMIVNTLLVLLSDTLVTETHATGDVRAANIYIGGLRLLILPVEYVALLVFGQPYVVLAVQILMEVASLFTRLWILNGITHTDHIGAFSREVLRPVALVTALSAAFTWGLHRLLPDDIWGLIILSALSGLFASAVIFRLGLSASERHTVWRAARARLPWLPTGRPM